jgi:hypothetical protein
MTTPFTLIDAGRPTPIEAHLRDDSVLLDRGALASATGWEYKPEGLCRGEACVPVRDPAIEVDGLIDLAVVATTLRRPLALDVAESAAYLGESATERGEQMTSMQARDFTLPDLAGRMHSLSDYRGRKVLLVVYASW